MFVERKGVLERVTATFQDDEHLLRVIDRIVSRVGRRIDDSSPMVDARLADGSRVNAIIPPLAVDGPLLSIRRFPGGTPEGGRPRHAEGADAADARFPVACVRARLNCLISGGTGAGKTTLLNVLSSFISEHERIVTIEDAAELQLRQEHVARLETRPPNVEGKGAVRQRQLVVNALRMRPDRIVIGEVRGEEALDMLQAMNTGHDGSLTTVHANTPRDALTRIETMIAMGATNLPERAMRQQIASAIQIVVQQTRLSDGSRRVTSISEITGMEGDIITMQDIFVFEKTGITQEGKVIGRFRATGVRPKCWERLQRRGHQSAAGDVRRRHGGALMLLPLIVFVVVGGIVLVGVCWASRAARQHGASARSSGGCARSSERRGRRRRAAGVGRPARPRQVRCPASRSCVSDRRRIAASRKLIDQSGVDDDAERDRRGRAACSRVVARLVVLMFVPAAVRRAAGRGRSAASLPFLCLMHRRSLAHEAVRGAVSRGARPAVARASRGPCVPDGAGHGRRRAAGAGRPGVQEDIRPAELRSAAEGGAATSWPSACRCSTSGSSSRR